MPCFHLSKFQLFNRYGFLFQMQVMKHSLVANGLTKSFQSALCGRISKDFRVSPTKIRISIATELAGFGDENLKTLAETYMKNKESTTRKFYVQHWAQRESLRISMKCANHFNLNKHEQLIVSTRNSGSNLSVDAFSVTEWIGDLKKKIKNTSGEDLEDDILCIQTVNKAVAESAAEPETADEPETAAEPETVVETETGTSAETDFCLVGPARGRLSTHSGPHG